MLIQGEFLMMKRFLAGVCFLTVLFVFQTLDVSGQFNMPYTVQGFLKDGNVPANGYYDVIYGVYESQMGGEAVGGTAQAGVLVVNGIFTITVQTPLAATYAPGRELWGEFSFKPSLSQQPFTVLSPRQRIGAVPFSISSVLSFDSSRLGGAEASQYVLTSDSRMTNARPPTAGSGNYIQNTNTQQANTNFNISGNGTVGGTFNTSVLSAINGTFSGNLSGNSVNVSNANGSYQIGGVTAFRMGNCNTFAGNQAGLFTDGSCNSFFGQNAGRQSDVGVNNSFFGAGAGYLNAGGNENSFFGWAAGNNSQGSRNSFFGVNAGIFNQGGNANTLLGHSSATFGVLTNATALGANSQVNQSNALVLGSINGVNGATADTTVGIGTTTPNTNSKLHVNGSVRVTNGAVYITNPNTVIITSPNGACWGITVNNSGALSTFPVNPCP
jgi:hypothetical protein